MRPQPILARAALTSIAASVFTVLIVFGVPMTADQQSALLQFIGVVGPYIVAFIVYAWSHHHVTPLSDPRNDQGQRLVPDGERVRRNRTTPEEGTQPT